ncbi:hypothetical protein ABBQ38_011933 [Trebouxia sp. C0009 RCD-2024]
MQSWEHANAADSQDLDNELQKVASQLEQQSGVLPLSIDTPEVFASADNWQSCVIDLNSSLAAFGYPSGLQLQSQQPEHLATTCNILHTLLVQRQRDVSQRVQFDDHFQRMRSDLNVSEQTKDRLRSQLDASQREHSSVANQWRVQESHLQAELSQTIRDRDEAQKQCADLQRRHAQAQHEIRRKDMQAEKLQEQLRNMLMERKREAKKAFDMAGAWSKDAASRPAGRLAKKGDEATIKMVVSSYEARQQELMQENKGLQAALSDLQSEYRTLANKQAAAQQLRAAAVGNLLEEEDLHRELQSADADEVQAELSSRMAAMRSKLEAVYDGPLQQELTTATERRLFQELQASKSMAQEQALLVQSALSAMKQLRESTNPGAQHSPAGSEQLNSTELAQLRAEYEARMAAAAKTAVEEKEAMTQRWHSWQQEQQVLMQRQLHDREQQAEALQESLLAKQQQLQLQAAEEQSRLQKQAASLAEAQQRFQQEQTAAREALRAFAPGFGAGKLLADAMARHTAKAVNATVCSSG